MKGLIALRKSTDAFTRSSKDEVEQNVTLITQPDKDGVEKEDLVLGYQVVASNGDIYAVFVNADTKERQFNFGEAYKHLAGAEVVADGNTAGVTAIADPAGVTRNGNGLALAPLTATILRLRKVNPAQEEKSQAPAAQEEKLSAASVANVQPLDAQKPQASEIKEANNQTEKTLPKTGTSTSLLALLGGFLAFLAGLLTFRKKE